VYDKTLPFLLQQLTVGFYRKDLPCNSFCQLQTEALATNKCVNVIYLDFKRTISHALRILGSRVTSGTDSGPTLNQGDSACARINKSLKHSACSLVSLFFLRGCIPGPLLFAVFTNNLPSHFTLVFVSLLLMILNILNHI